jgi:predicted amidophosphoribosyltransferase
MNAIGVSVSLLVVVFAILLVLFYRMRRLKPQMAGYASQRMCPACGLITPRSKASCQECGKAFVNAPAGRQARR